MRPEPSKCTNVCVCAQSLSLPLHRQKTNALSFYKSQNVLGWSNFIVPDQKFIYILWQSQKFCARQKDNLHSVKLVYVPAQKFFKRRKMQSNFWAGSKNFGPAQNILRPVKGQGINSLYIWQSELLIISFFGHVCVWKLKCLDIFGSSLCQMYSL